ncbi:hypothetical protein J3A83DRAFT_4194310 [Scleroderma citrinum]
MTIVVLNDGEGVNPPTPYIWNLLKCKVDDNNVQHLAPPRKKMALTVSYTGLSDTDLLTHQLSLKCKTVFEEDFRMKHICFDLGTPCPVCKVFQELVGPHYLKLIGLEASESGWIRINNNNCNGLLLWKCLNTFVPPKVFWFSGAASMADKSFQIMHVFSKSLSELQVFLPHLVCLEVDKGCPTLDLIGFLTHYYFIKCLIFTPYDYFSSLPILDIFLPLIDHKKEDKLASCLAYPKWDT